MKTEIMIAVLALMCIGSLAAFLVTLAKLQEEKERRWDEISRAVGLENEIAFWKEANDDKIKDILYYHKECEKLATERDALQDRLSALLCPMNDHVWKDGVCAKCGRAKDAEIH